MEPRHLGAPTLPTEHILLETLELALSGLLVTLHRLAVLLQVELQRLHVVVEAQRGHGEEDVLAVDRLPLLGLRRKKRTDVSVFDMPCFEEKK